jgi:hypothetical protein
MNTKLTEKVNQKKERHVQIKNRQGFTQVSNQMLSDLAISYKAKGILCHLLSHDQEKFVITSNTLIRNSREGEKAIQTGILELKRNGYLQIVQESGNKGKWTYILNMFGNKLTDTPKIGDTPKTDTAVLGSSYNKNTNLKNNNKKSEEEQAPQIIQETPLQEESLTHSQSFQSLGIGIQRPEQILQAIYRQLSSEGIKFERGSDVQAYVKYREQIEADPSLLVEKINRMRKLAWLKENYVPLKRNITNEKAVKILDGMVTMPNTFSWAFSNYSTEVEPLFDLVKNLKESLLQKEQKERLRKEEDRQARFEQEERLRELSWEEKEAGRKKIEDFNRRWQAKQSESTEQPSQPAVQVPETIREQIDRITRQAEGRTLTEEEREVLKRLFQLGREQI